MIDAHLIMYRREGGNFIETTQTVLSNYKDLLNMDDLMKIFGVSKQTIYKEIRNGKFGTPIKIGRAYKIPRMFVLNKFFANYE